VVNREENNFEGGIECENRWSEKELCG